jgi:hypothetical protein
MIRICLALLTAFWLWAAPAAPAAAQTTPRIELAVDRAGHYTITTHAPELTFGGDLGLPPAEMRTTDGQDRLGAFHAVEFDYGGRTSRIVAYADIGAVLFATSYTPGSLGMGAFPVLSQLPALPYRLSYHDAPFSPYQLNTLDQAGDSPWLFFDASGSGFLISPAGDFLVSRMSLGADGSLSSGLSVDLSSLSGSLEHQTLLLVGGGINQLFDAWGNTLTSLRARARPANDADLTLGTFGYWTDNGASYYYHYEPSLGYAGTLLAVRRELEQRGINLGYLQLDSWWYPKGPHARWDDTTGGIYRYRAAVDLFPDGLASFHQQVGLPLVTHARWIDPASPYRSELASSGNVMTDPRYWSDLMGYLRSSGVVTYEQDWLGAQAQPLYDLSAPQQFMGNMAADAQQDGLTLQYCMPLPRHVLQSVEYPSVTSMRVSDDRFDRNRWDTFLYTSRLASALGVWPWSDVFMSTERDNLLLSLLSGGVVGVGDALGAENVDNLRHVMRADAVLVKPDAALVPTDASILAEAAGGNTSPMLAWTYSQHADLRGLYVFGYARNGGSQSVAFSPASLGLTGSAYVYDYFGRSGTVLGPGESYTANVSDGTYFVVAPLGPSGIALVGDAGEYATLGKKRISALADNGSVQATLEFAAGEQSVTLIGYAAAPPTLSVDDGSADGLSFDASSGRFSVQVHPTISPSRVRLTMSP